MSQNEDKRCLSVDPVHPLPGSSTPIADPSRIFRLPRTSDQWFADTLGDGLGVGRSSVGNFPIPSVPTATSSLSHVSSSSLHSFRPRPFSGAVRLGGSMYRRDAEMSSPQKSELSSGFVARCPPQLSTNSHCTPKIVATFSKASTSSGSIFRPLTDSALSAWARPFRSRCILARCSM